MAVQCPKGHVSTDADYCSECGARIGSVSVKPEAKNGIAKSGGDSISNDICSDCGTPRTPGSRFCEVCRFDFQSKTVGGEVIPSVQPPVVSTPTVSPITVVPPPIVVTTPTHSVPQHVPVDSPEIPAINVLAERLNVVITVDPSLVTDQSLLASCPTTASQRIFPLDLDENLVGRRSDAKAIYPEVEVNDPGVSHRHVKLLKQGDGTFAVLELGSANGTIYNGVELEPGVLTKVKAGDELLIGMWTRLQLRSRG